MIYKNGKNIISVYKGSTPITNTGYVFKSLPDGELYFYTYIIYLINYF